jgi:hypothetical protein
MRGLAMVRTSFFFTTTSPNDDCHLKNRELTQPAVAGLFGENDICGAFDITGLGPIRLAEGIHQSLSCSKVLFLLPLTHLRAGCHNPVITVAFLRLIRSAEVSLLLFFSLRPMMNPKKQIHSQATRWCRTLRRNVQLWCR